MPETESLTLTINFKHGVFETKLEKNGYFDFNLTRVLRTAIKEAVNFASDETAEPVKQEPLEQEPVKQEPVKQEPVKQDFSTLPDLKDLPPLVPAWDSPLDVSDDEVTPVRRYIGRKRSGCRDPKLCFVNGQRIRHKCRGAQGWWDGVFHNSPLWTGIEGEGMSFSADDCISQFARAHYYSQGLNPSYPPPVYSYWDECECLIDGQWISTYNLSPLN
jgi:hypothetical protein